MHPPQGKEYIHSMMDNKVIILCKHLHTSGLPRIMLIVLQQKLNKKYRSRTQNKLVSFTGMFRQTLMLYDLVQRWTGTATTHGPTGWCERGSSCLCARKIMRSSRRRERKNVPKRKFYKQTPATS